jgi:hypothetical protein
MDRARALALAGTLVVAYGLVGCGVVLPQLESPTPLPTATVETVAVSTPTPVPTPSPVGSPAPVPTPPRPQDFEEYPETIVAYLNDSKGDVDGLRETLRSWQALQHVTHLLRADVDDDGVGELLLVIVDKSPDHGINLVGDLLVVDLDGGDFHLAFSAGTESPLLDPALLEVDDLNQDGHTELAFSSTSCGAHTCFTTIHIVSSATGTYEDLTGEGIEMSYVDPTFSDWDGDGVPELIMHGGTIGSVGAGPQRERTEVYKWDGVAYVLSQTVYDHSNYLYFKVLDANQALLNADYESAKALYREAIDSNYLVTWMEESEREELSAFSRYRLSLTYLILGDVDQARSVRDELLAEQPDNIYAQVVTTLWQAYEDGASLLDACKQVGFFAAEHPETAGVLSAYGYGNPSFTPEEVCPADLF